MYPNKHQILVVDDQEDNLISTQCVLERWGYAVDIARSGEEAISILKSATKEYAVALVDYLMPGKNGAETTLEIRKYNSEVIVLIHTCDDSQDSAVESMRAGAEDFVEKSEDPEYLKQAVLKACVRFEDTRRSLKFQVPQGGGEQLLASMSMIGRSARMVELALQVRRSREMKKPIMILGASGTGKELVAKALHTGPKGLFFPVNCASYTRDGALLESELFGHEKGAFTGALNRKVGILEAAKGGTVFLDEIHHLSPAAQAQLLRAIEEKKVRRVGANQEYEIDFRLIVATKPDIEARVEAGTFLGDLYYRLKYITIEVPDLKDRPEDIEPLVAYFCRKFQEETGKKKTFLMSAVRALEGYAWPGNVRELDGYIFQLLTDSPGTVIGPKDLDSRFVAPEPRASGVVSFQELEDRQEKEKREFLTSVIRSSRSVAQAASTMGMPPTTLRSMVGRYGLKKELDRMA